VSETGDPHLGDDVFAAYLDRTLPPSARAIADTHLAVCASCRDELVVMSSLARSTSGARRFYRLAVPLAVAATLLLFIRGPWSAPPQPLVDDGKRLRESTGVAGLTAGRLAALRPPDNATVAAESLRFVWHGEPRDAGYHLVVTDDGGAVRWTLDTSDTTASLPDSVRLERARTYYWYVDALGGDGRTRASALRRFQVVP